MLYNLPVGIEKKIWSFIFPINEITNVKKYNNYCNKCGEFKFNKISCEFCNNLFGYKCINCNNYIIIDNLICCTDHYLEYGL